MQGVQYFLPVVTCASAIMANTHNTEEKLKPPKNRDARMTTNIWHFPLPAPEEQFTSRGCVTVTFQLCIVLLMSVFLCHCVSRRETIVKIVSSPPCAYYPKPRAATKENFCKRSAKISHWHGIDNGIHSGVEVSKPRKNRKQDFKPVNTLNITDGKEDVGHKEGHPTQAKHTHDDTQSLGRFLFLCQFTEFSAEGKVFPLFWDHSGRLDVAVRMYDVIVLTSARNRWRGWWQIIGAPRRQRVVVPDNVYWTLRITVTVRSPGVGHLFVLEPALLLLLGHVSTSVYPQRHGLPAFTVRRVHHFSTDLQAVYLLRGSNVDFVIREYDDTHGNIEGYEGGEDQVSGIVGEHTDVCLRKVGGDAAPPENRRKTDSCRTYPHERNKKQRPTRRHLAGVRYGIRDSPVSVQWYHWQVEDRRRTRQHIDGMPNVTPVKRKTECSQRAEKNDQKQLLTFKTALKRSVSLE